MEFKIRIYQNKYKLIPKIIKEFKERIISSSTGIGCELFTSGNSYFIRVNVLPTSYVFIDPENECGKIIDIDEEYVTIKITNKNINAEKLKELIDSNKILAYARGTGIRNAETNEFDIIKIITFDLVCM